MWFNEQALQFISENGKFKYLTIFINTLVMKKKPIFEHETSFMTSIAIKIKYSNENKRCSL